MPATHERALPPTQLLRLEPDTELLEVRQRLVDLLDEARAERTLVPDEEGEVVELREESEREEDVAANDREVVRLGDAERAEGDEDGRLERAGELRDAQSSALSVRDKSRTS